MYDVIVNKDYHSTIAQKYRIKKALVSWIIRNFTKNPQLIDEIELKELINLKNRMRVSTAAKRLLDSGGNIWNIGQL